MANSRKKCVHWGPFIAGDIVDCLIFREVNGEAIEKTIKMRVIAAQADKVPPGYAPVIYKYKKSYEKKESLTHYIPIDSLSWPSDT